MLSEQQRRRKREQAEFGFWVKPWSTTRHYPFKWVLWSFPKETNVWRGCVNYEWMVFNKFSIYLQVPIRNWTPPTDEQYAGREDVIRNRMLAQALVNDGTYSNVSEAEAEIAAFNATGHAASAA